MTTSPGDRTDSGMADLPTPDEILAHRAAIDPVFLDSPVLRHPALDEALGCACTLKIETMNPVRSFKGRGTEAFMAAQRGPIVGVIATSTGNFGQGLARAAARREIPATIVCPTDANPMKVEAMRRLGATVLTAEGSEGNGKALARRIAEDSGLVLVEDGAHREIAAGAGGIAHELTAAGLEPDVLVIQIGDGALATGVGAWMKARSPKTRVIGVVAAGAPSMTLSIDAGCPVDAPSRTIADGMAIDRPVPLAIELLPRCVDEIVAVDDDQLLVAIRLLMDAAGVLAEPSGAAGVAALMADRRFAGSHAAAVVTGSNIDPGLLSRVL